MHLYIQTVIIKLYILSLILIFPYFHKGRFRKIRKVLDSVNWERLLNKKDIDAQVAVFNEIILNVFRN